MAGPASRTKTPKRCKNEGGCEPPPKAGINSNAIAYDSILERLNNIIYTTLKSARGKEMETCNKKLQIKVSCSAVAVGSNGSPNYWKRLDVQLLDEMIHTKCCMVKGVCVDYYLSWRRCVARDCVMDTSFADKYVVCWPRL